MAKADLTAQYLRTLIDYNPASGVFTWLPRTPSDFSNLKSCNIFNAKYADCVAGGVCNGYLSIRVENRAYWAHRLAWLYIHGNWPNHEIDHINGLRLDNRIINLRDVTRTVNQQNIRSRTGQNKSLPLGVAKLSAKLKRPFKAGLQANNVQIHLGYFATAKDAHEAYVLAKRRMHEGCTI